ncbi:MAG: hypothetical protein LC624_12050 [Halobacteriales archaeon]|nr:hypothetical protein [Halobacteriales archaeon]
MGPALRREPHPSDALRGAHGQHLRGKVVGLGVDAGSAAPSAVRVARELLRWGAEVQPLLVPGAEAWVPDVALHYATGSRPLRFDPPRLDALLLAPAGPELLRKLRLGMADSAPLQAALALRGQGPVIVAVDQAPEGARPVPDALDADGALRPEVLARVVCASLSTSRVAGKRVLVVAGGAAEPFDAIRTVQRRGDAGVARAAAEELRRRGALVTLLLGPGVQGRARQERAYDTLRDLALMAPLLGQHDVLLAEDSLPALSPVQQAGKVRSGQAGFGIELHHAPDVLGELRRHAARAHMYRATTGDVAAQGRALADAAEALA